MEIPKCFICSEDLNKYPTYSQEKCNHHFHTHCIVTWYRIGNNFCPCCNNKRSQFGRRIHYYQRELCERRILNLEKEKNLNKNTKKKIDDLKNIKIQLKENYRKRVDKKYIKENNLSYKEAKEFQTKNIKEYYSLHAKQTAKYKQIMKETTSPIIVPCFVDLS